MDSFCLFTSILVLLPSKTIYDPNAASVSAYRFPFLKACSILNIEKFSSIFYAIVLYDAKLGSFKEKLPLV